IFGANSIDTNYVSLWGVLYGLLRERKEDLVLCELGNCKGNGTVHLPEWVPGTRFGNLITETQIELLETRIFFHFRDVTLCTELQAMGAKFYISLLLVILVTSPVYSTRLRRPQDTMKSPSFLYGKRY
ncbi:hypothetical protein P5673_005003, partial [Acropora cervicornis]